MKPDLFPILNNISPKKNGTSISGLKQLMDRPMDRREATVTLTGALVAGMGLLSTSCSPMASAAEKETAQLDWESFFQGNYQVMTDDEKKKTVQRLERSHELHTGKQIRVSDQAPRDKVLYGYAFNVSKCRGYMDCIRACIKGAKR